MSEALTHKLRHTVRMDGWLRINKLRHTVRMDGWLRINKMNLSLCDFFCRYAVDSCVEQAPLAVLAHTIFGNRRPASTAGYTGGEAAEK